MGKRFILVKVDAQYYTDEQDRLCVDPICALMEVYEDREGLEQLEPACISSRKELELAFNDVKRHGVNTSFYETGTFTYDPMREKWSWVRHFQDPIGPVVKTLDNQDSAVEYIGLTQSPDGIRAA